MFRAVTEISSCWVNTTVSRNQSVMNFFWFYFTSLCPVEVASGHIHGSRFFKFFTLTHETIHHTHHSQSLNCHHQDRYIQDNSTPYHPPTSNIRHKHCISAPISVSCKLCIILYSLRNARATLFQSPLLELHDRFRVCVASFYAYCLSAISLWYC